MAEDADMRNELEEMQRRADQLADEVRLNWKLGVGVGMRDTSTNRSWSGKGFLGLILFSVSFTLKEELEKKWSGVKFNVTFRPD